MRWVYGEESVRGENGVRKGRAEKRGEDAS
jgi:hypothetical protein